MNDMMAATVYESNVNQRHSLRKRGLTVSAPAIDSEDLIRYHRPQNGDEKVRSYLRKKQR